MKIIIHFSEDVRIDTGQHFNAFDNLKQSQLQLSRTFHHVSKKGIKRISYTIVLFMQYLEKEGLYIGSQMTLFHQVLTL